jgi:hypothetical protein
MKTTWSFVAVLLFCIACNKDESVESGGKVNPTVTYYLRCKIDGVDKTFNVAPVVSIQDLGGGTISYTIAGKATTDAANYESFNIALLVGDSLKTGAYSEQDSSSTYMLAAVYNPNTTDPAKIYASQMDADHPFQLTLNVITDSLMSGSFNGKLLMNGLDTNLPPITVTEGDFTVKVQ